MRGFVCLVALWGCANGAAAADRYTIRDIGSIPGGNATYANGINRAGDVVGATYRVYEGTINAPSPVYYHRGKLDNIGGFGSAESINDEGNIVGFAHPSLTSTYTQAFFYNHGHTVDLGTLPGDTDSDASAINDRNEIVGDSSNDHVHAYIYDGAMHPLGTLPGDTDSIASAINNKGQIVGESYKLVQSGGEQYSPSHAFLYEHGQMRDIGTLPNTNVAAASGINESGLIVGSAGYESLTETGPTHAFLYDGSMHDLGTLGGTASYALAISKAGVIVGTSDIAGDPSNPQSDAFVYLDGVMYDLNGLINEAGAQWTQLVQATAINESGQIVGYGFRGEGLRGFLLTPVPVAMALLEAQITKVASAQTSLSNIKSAKSAYEAQNLPGACSQIGAAFGALPAGGMDAALREQLTADATAISVALGCH